MHVYFFLRFRVSLDTIIFILFYFFFVYARAYTDIHLYYPANDCHLVHRALLKFKKSMYIYTFFLNFAFLQTRRIFFSYTYASNTDVGEAGSTWASLAVRLKKKKIVLRPAGLSRPGIPYVCSILRITINPFIKFY